MNVIGTPTTPQDMISVQCLCAMCVRERERYWHSTLPQLANPNPTPVQRGVKSMRADESNLSADEFLTFKANCT